MAADPLIGTVIGNCEIKSRVGQGGMGVVYLAEHRVIHDRRAVKIMNVSLAGQDQAREGFLNEVRLPATLDHPNILIVHDAGETDLGVLYLVMPYVRGADLQVLMERGGPLTIDDAVSILSAVADALDEAHATGLIHRDVKPANVLVGELVGIKKRRAVYLSDFGLMKALDRAERATGTSTGMIVGTPAYMAPEIWRAEKGISGAIDQYALACTFFGALTGQPPYTPPTIEAMMTAHLAGEVPLASDLRPTLPAEVDAALARGLAKDPTDRFESCSALIDAVAATVGTLPPAPEDTLETVLREQTVVHIETVAMQRSGDRRSPPPPWRWIAVAATAVLLGVLLTWILWPNGAEPDDAAADETGAARLEPVFTLDSRPILAVRSLADGSILVAVEGTGGVGADILRFDETTQEVSDVARISGTPIQLVPDGDATWILTREEGLYFVEADRAEPIEVGLGGIAKEMTLTATRMWVTLPARGAVALVSRVDPTTFDPVQVEAGAEVITVTGGVELVAGDEGVTSLTPEGSPIDSVEVAGSPIDLLNADGDGWLATSDGAISAISVDEGLLELERVGSVGGLPLLLSRAGDDSAVWAAERDRSRLTRFDTQRRGDAESVRLDDPVSRINTNDAGVVVAVTTAGTVYRLDANTAEVKSEEQIGGPAVAVVQGAGEVVVFGADGNVYLVPL